MAKYQHIHVYTFITKNDRLFRRGGNKNNDSGRHQRQKKSGSVPNAGIEFMSQKTAWLLRASFPIYPSRECTAAERQAGLSAQSGNGIKAASG